MPTRKYDIVLKAEIEIGGVFEADNRDEAIAAARQELRSGELSNVTIERAIFLDDEEPNAPEPVFPDLP